MTCAQKELENPRACQGAGFDPGRVKQETGVDYKGGGKNAEKTPLCASGESSSFLAREGGEMKRSKKSENLCADNGRLKEGQGKGRGEESRRR